MSSTLLISYCDVPLRAAVITPSAPYSEDRGVDNLFLGGRHLYAELKETAGSAYIDFLLPDGQTREVDHLIIGGDSQLVSDEVERVMLQTWDGSNFVDLVGWDTGSPYYSNAVALNARNRDKLATCSSTAANLFRLEMEASGVSKFTLSKLHFGSFFDMGIAPDDFQYPQEEIAPGELRSPSGRREFSRIQHPVYRYEIVWTLVTDEKANEFRSKLLHDPLRRFVYLYTPSVHQILNNERLVFCELLQEETSIRPIGTDTNEVSVAFREVR